MITESEFNLKKTNQILHKIYQPTLIARIKCTCSFSPDDQLINTSKIILIRKLEKKIIPQSHIKKLFTEILQLPDGFR